MSNLYNVLSDLCTERGISGYRMCKDVGIQPSIMTDLKMGRRGGVNAETANKLAGYFSVTVGYLLGIDAGKSPTVSDEGLPVSLQEPYMQEIHDTLLKLKPETRKLILAQIEAAKAFEDDAKK